MRNFWFLGFSVKRFEMGFFNIILGFCGFGVRISILIIGGAVW